MAEKDIVPELIENIDNAFRKNCIKDVEMRKLSEKAADGTATYSDAYKYAESVGTARANAFKSEVSSDVLPDGRMYYNIASRVMEDSLTTDHEMVANFAQQVQEAINKNAGISLKAQKADLDEDRIDGFVQRLSREEDYDKASWLLNEPIKTHARSVVDDTVKKNAEFQHKAGIKAQVKRDAASDCCKWCDSLVGDYTYPGVPREVFARHDNCRCSLDYNGRKLTAYQSGGVAHSFRDQGETEKIEERKKLAESIEKEGLSQKNRGYKVNITDQAIIKTSSKGVNGYSSEEVTQLNRQILEIAKSQNDSNEVAMILSKSGFSKPILGSINGVDILSDPEAFHLIRSSEIALRELIVSHNHPSLTYFSLDDISVFVNSPNIGTMQVVTNQGKVWSITKKDNYDDILISERFKKTLEETTGQRKAVIVEQFLKENSRFIKRGR